jgi:fructose-specific phosphotransferase system IIC component
MAEPDTNSIPALIRSVLEDTRDLIREELALARAEIREQMTTVKTVGIAFGAAAFAAVVGSVLLCIAVGGVIAYLFTWPMWAGYGTVAVLLLIGAALFVLIGQSQLAAIRALPKTTQTVKENLAWMKSKSAEK